MADLEKAITQTKGAIVYYHKNKHTLFHNILDELFFPVFEMPEKVWEKLSRCSIAKFHQRYKTPFERVRDDLAENYGIENPARALFNIFIQGSKHYEGFSTGSVSLSVSEANSLQTHSVKHYHEFIECYILRYVGCDLRG